jgi:hypothetical protein
MIPAQNRCGSRFDRITLKNYGGMKEINYIERGK